MIVLIMGVSGSGKTTIGKLLAARLDCGFSDADSFHSPENKARMARGIPLTDADRLPWLQAMRAAIDRQRTLGHDHVFACSALRRSYRDLLRGNAADLHVVLLHGPSELLHQRVRSRSGHFFDPGLLQDQLATLEPPNADEALTLDIRLPPEDIVETIVQALRITPDAG